VDRADIDPSHETLADGDGPIAGASTPGPSTGAPSTGAPSIGGPSSARPRLPRPEPSAGSAGTPRAGGPHDGDIVRGAPLLERRKVPPAHAAPAVEHDGWRAGDTIDIDETPRRRFSFQVPPYLKVAAVIAVATSFGALAGTFAATSFGHDPAPPAVVRVPDEGALKATVADLKRDVGSLRTSLESSTKALQTQTAKLADRMERAERAQAEPAQKLAKLSEAIDRMDKRVGQAAAAQSQGSSQVQATGAPPTTLQAQAAAQSAAAAQAAAQGGPPPSVQASALPPPAPMPIGPVAVASADVTGALGDPRPPAPAVVPGWVVRDVRRGIALVEGRYGYVEVETGDMLPGVGRVESIRKQDGRWIVVTSRGLILGR
jgi:hypothetical protein